MLTELRQLSVLVIITAYNIFGYNNTDKSSKRYNERSKQADLPFMHRILEVTTATTT